jgi:hypothetical protein
MREGLFACWQPASSATDSHINKIVYNYLVKSSEFKRWLEKQGAAFTPARARISM